MKILTLVLLSGLCASGLASFKAKANLEVGVSLQIHAKADFNTPLVAYGQWVEVGSYGRCWRPAGVAFGWRPYCHGHWVWTDCGWYWSSDEPWAWACYHYGNWVYDDSYGWVWIPAVEWAPAWVEWRYGGGFIGWAPLPPPGIHVRHGAATTQFVFVETRHFTEPVRPTTIILNRPAVIKKTRLVSGVERQTRKIAGADRKVVIDEGPGLNVVEKATGRKLSATPIQEAARKTWVPPFMTRRAGQPAGHGKSAGFEQRPSVSASHKGPSRPAGQPYRQPEQKQSMDEKSGRPSNAGPPARAPGGSEVAPHPDPRPPVGRAPKVPDRKGKEHGKDRR